MNDIQLHTVNMSDAHQIFISYSHMDIQFAFQLKGELERCGYVVWLDTSSIPGGDIWLESITQGINEAFAMISIVSKSAIESKWIRREYLYADEQGKDILPVIIDGSNCPFYMMDRHAILYNGDFKRCFLSIQETMDRWVSSVAQAVVSQNASRSTSASAHADVPLLPSQNRPLASVPSQRADTRLQAPSPALENFHPDIETTQLARTIAKDGHFSGDIATSEQRIGWEDTSPNEPFYGRATELLTLKRWTLENRCRAIAILGMGGMGKTSLAVALVDQVKTSFSHIFWRSLRNAPPFRSVLQDCVQYVSDWQTTGLPESVNDQILLLLDYLRQHRCLIVLDNMETIMQAGDRAGEYRKGYEAYGRLLEFVGREKHQSCLLLTSREKPKDIAYLEGATLPIRSYPLKGLKSSDGQKILKEKHLRGAKDVRESLIRRYVGNPLALKLAAQLIRELFEGDIESFLKDGETVFDDIHDVLDQQFERVSDVERGLMYWLAIEREAVSLETFQKDMIGPVTRREIQEALLSLLRRNLIEAGNNSFLLQNVVMEYITDRFAESVVEEVRSEKLVLFDRHALIKADTKDYIRESQTRLILTPVVQRLLTSLGTEGIKQKCQEVLAFLQKDSAQQRGYAAGNVLNMLLMQGYSLCDYDFAHLTLRQAYLRGQELPDVRFAHAHFIDAVFTDIFGSAITIALSPNGEFLAIGTINGEVKLWNVQDRTPALVCSGHTGWTRSVTFSPDGRLLASCSNDNTVRLWEVSSGNCLHVLNLLGIALLLQEQSSSPEALAFSRDGMTLVIGINDQVWLWDIHTTNRIRALQGHTAWIRMVDVSPDGQLVVSGSEDQTIRLWDLSTGQCLNVLEGHSAPVRWVAFSPDGHLVASSSYDHTVRLWEVGTGQCINILEGHTDWLCSVTFSPDGRLLASSSEDQTIRLWEVSSGQCLRILQGHTAWVFGAIFSPDGRLLVSSGDDRNVRFWETESGQCIATLQGYSNRIDASALDSAGHWIASGSEDLIVRIWDAESGQCLKALEGHTNRIFSLAFSPNGHLLASGSNDRTICLWEVSTGQRITLLQGHDNWVVTLAFSPDGRLLVSGSEDHSIRLWEVSTGQCLKILQDHSAWVRWVAFSPDGHLLASCSNDQTIRLWEVSSGQCLKVLQGHSAWVRSVTFSPDGHLLASASNDHSIRLWDVSTGQYVDVLQRGEALTYPVAFCPDGHMLANSSDAQTVQLWDLNEGHLVRAFQGHRGNVSSLAFSSDGVFF